MGRAWTPTRSTKVCLAHGRQQQGAGPRSVVGMRRCIYLKCKVSKEHYRSTNGHSPLLRSRGLRAAGPPAAARSTPTGSASCQHLRVAEDPDESTAWKSPESYRTSLKANAEVYQATGQVVCERRTTNEFPQACPARPPRVGIFRHPLSTPKDASRKPEDLRRCVTRASGRPSRRVQPEPPSSFQGPDSISRATDRRLSFLFFCNSSVTENRDRVVAGWRSHPDLKLMEWKVETTRIFARNSFVLRTQLGGVPEVTE